MPTSSWCRACHPITDYRFKHALIQDAAYENLLKSRRLILHRRVGETLRDKFAGTAAAEPELLAHHFTQAGMTETAIEWWGKAGQKSLERSALVEAAQQFTRALHQITTLPGTTALRREQIKLQVAIITPLIHIKGYSAPETKAAIEQARLLLEQADALGEAPGGPLALFEVLYGAFVANVMAFNADVSRDIAAHVLELAEKQSASFPRVLGHNHLGGSLMLRGEIAEARTHFDQAVAIYDRAEQRSLATRFGEDQGVATLSMRPCVLWLLGYPEAALRDTDDVLKNARETGQAASLMFALHFTAVPLLLRGDYSRATALAQELCALADEKDLPFWKINGSLYQGSLFALTGNASSAVRLIASGITAVRPTGVTAWMPRWLSYLAIARAYLGQIDDAWRCIGEAISTIAATKERWFEAETNRIAGEIALMSPDRNAEKAHEYYDRALAVARQQEAKSWELRATMSLARLWRDQGKVQQARELLAPVYGWFTEGFETRDLKEAKALLEELAR
jgi:predicted ATPase